MSMNEMNQKAKAYFDLQEMIAELTAEAESIKDDMKAYMVENSTEELNGIGWRATWHNTTTNRFDSSAFKKAHSDLYTAFCKPVSGTRFTLNTVKA
jgi:predicted phage-related endonuclease